jgi:hypothetical protein
MSVGAILNDQRQKLSAKDELALKPLLHSIEERRDALRKGSFRNNSGSMPKFLWYGAKHGLGQCRSYSVNFSHVDSKFVADTVPFMGAWRLE